MLLRPVSDQELSEDEDHPQLMQRLTDLREVRANRCVIVLLLACHVFGMINVFIC